jgi:hypothetical protein
LRNPWLNLSATGIGPSPVRMCPSPLRIRAYAIRDSLESTSSALTIAAPTRGGIGIGVSSPVLAIVDAVSYC